MAESENALAAQAKPLESLRLIQRKIEAVANCSNAFVSKAVKILNATFISGARGLYSQQRLPTKY